MDGLELADGAVENQFAQALEIGICVALGAVLGGELDFVLQVIGAHRADLFDGDAQRLFAIDVLAAIEAQLAMKAW